MTLDNHLSYRNYNKRKALSPFLKGFIWGGIFTLTATISGIIGATFALKSSLPVNITPILEQIETFKQNGLTGFFLPRLKQPINILVMGIDKVPNTSPGSPEAFSGRSDTMLLVRFQSKDNSLRILSIPRDSRVEMPNGGYDKVNGANARGGADFAMKVLNHNLNDVKIDRYVRVTTDVFKELVDLVGGVEVYVPTDMQYTDVTQKLKIDLKQGLQTLDGEKAEQFARFRKDNLGDIGRVQRQQILLKALREKIQSPIMITRIPQIKDLLTSNIDTNLTSQEIISLFGFTRHLKKDNIKMVMLPGRFSTPNEYNLSYWLISDRGKNKVMNEYFNLESSSGDNLPYTWRSPNQIKIAIQNGTSNKDIPLAVAKYLEKHDFKNVYVSSNFAPPTDKTQIIAQQGDRNSAEMLQRILEFGHIDISSTGDLDSDLTIQVGEDAQKLIIKN
jgi:LCP family protein required for cell wall assembly